MRGRSFKTYQNTKMKTTIKTNRGIISFAVAAVFAGAGLPSIALAQAVTLGTGAAGQYAIDTAIGTNANAYDGGSTQGSTAIGANATAVDNSVAVGYGAATNSNDVAVGASATANANSVAVGNASNASISAVAVGQAATAGASSVAVGWNTNAAGASAIAIGNGASATGFADGVAVGYGSSSTGLASVALGAAATASGAGSVAIGQWSTDGGQTGVVSFGGGTLYATRRLINVSAGINANDAVNMTQLGGVASALGGGAGFNSSTGALNAPVFTIQTKTGTASYTTVSAALVGLGTRVTALENSSGSGTPGPAGPAGATGASGPAGPIGATGATGATGPQGTAGTNSTSGAATTAQVQTIMSTANSYTDQQIGALSGQINGLANQISSVDSMARSGIAADAALTRTAALPYAPGHLAMATGAATYRGQVAGAIGFGYWSQDGRNNVNGGIAYSGSNSAVFSAGYAHIF